MNGCLAFSTFPGFIKIEKLEEQFSEISPITGEFPSDVIRQNVPFEAFLEFGHDRLGKGQGSFCLIQEGESHRLMRCYEQSEPQSPAVPAKPASLQKAELLVAVDNQNGPADKTSRQRMNGEAALAVVQREREECLALVFQLGQERCQQRRLPRSVRSDDRPSPTGVAKAIDQGCGVQARWEVERNGSRTHGTSAKRILRSFGF